MSSSTRSCNERRLRWLFGPSPSADQGANGQPISPGAESYHRRTGHMTRFCENVLRIFVSSPLQRRSGPRCGTLNNPARCKSRSSWCRTPCQSREKYLKFSGQMGPHGLIYHRNFGYDQRPMRNFQRSDAPTRLLNRSRYDTLI